MTIPFFLLIGTNLQGITNSLERIGRVVVLPANALPETALKIAPAVDAFCLCDAQVNAQGLALLHELRSQQFYQPTLVYAESMSYEDIEKCLAVYINGFCVVEDTSPDILTAGVQMVLQGHFWMSPQCCWTMHLACYAKYLLPLQANDASTNFLLNNSSKLSVRQIEMLKWIAEGLSNKDISQRSGLSVKTIETHIQRLFKKLGVYSRTQALVIAAKQGYLPKEEEEKKHNAESFRYGTLRQQEYKRNRQQGDEGER